MWMCGKGASVRRGRFDSSESVAIDMSRAIASRCTGCGRGGGGGGASESGIAGGDEPDWFVWVERTRGSGATSDGGDNSVFRAAA